MTPERWGKIERLFHAALEHEPAERPGFLGRECAGDVTLCREVETLLTSYGRAGDFIETPVSDVAAALLEEDRLGPETGQMVGPFRVAEVLARGGMGEVYLAEDMRLGRKVALKLLPPQFTADPDRVRRFGQEARAASALNHPNIVTVYDIGRADSLHYIAAEFVGGETLRERMARAPLAAGEVLDVATQVASALEAAHEAGIVHRDVKPENVMVRPDRIVKVLDFGLAKLAPPEAVRGDRQSPVASTVKTNPGVVMGTVAYMSPEQARGEEVDARTDVWSLGVVLYEMVAGRVPFEGETPSHVIVSIIESEPPLGSEVPAELGRIISKALCKERAERYQTAGEMALDLKSLREELTVEARLERFRRPDATGGEAATKGDGRVAPETAHLLRATTAGAVIARVRSSAEHLADGVRRHRGGAIFTSTTALLLIAALAYFTGFNRGGGDAIDSVAVLPFVNVTADPDTEYLSEGISDQIISSLSRLPGLKVNSFSSVLRYKGRQADPQAAGRELNVRAVLVGRITQRGDALALSAELVDVRDSRRLWAGQYNGKLSDILTVQDGIAEEIAERLRLRLGAQERQQLTKHHTENTDAYHAYLKGRYLLDKRKAQKSVEYFEQAVKFDPNYAPAYASLAYAHVSLATLGARQTQEALPQAKEAAARALALDDTLAEAHAALGSVRFLEWDWAGAERAYRRAREIDPNPERSHFHLVMYLRVMKRFDEAVAVSQRALELDPLSVQHNRDVAIALYYARRYDEAIEHCRKTLELDPNMPVTYNWLARAYEQKGLYEQAVEAHLKFGLGPGAESALRDAYAASGWEGFWRKVLDLRKERAKQGEDASYAMAEIYARLGEKDQAFAWLEKAYGQRHPYITRLNADPIWDLLRSDPRYADLVRRTGLEP